MGPVDVLSDNGGTTDSDATEDHTVSKITWGVMAGLALATAAAVPLATSGSDTPAPQATVNAAATVAPTAGAVKAAATTAKVAPKPVVTTAKVVKKVRTIKLSIPADAKVGSNVTGFIQVTDTAGTIYTPVPNVAVALQQKRGLGYIDVADGLTDETGRFAVSFTSRANTTWRAVLKPTTGAKVYSTSVVSTASAQVTWAARPVMTAVHGKAVSYGFRVSPATGMSGQLQIANTAKPGKWILVKSVPIPAAGVLTQKVVFPTAGTWLVRGASVGNATNAAGYTTALTVAVS